MPATMAQHWNVHVWEGAHEEMSDSTETDSVADSEQSDYGLSSLDLAASVDDQDEQLDII